MHSRVQLKGRAEELQLRQVAAGSVLGPLVGPEIHVATRANTARPVIIKIALNGIKDAQIKRGASAILCPFCPEAMNGVLSATFLRCKKRKYKK